MQLFVACLYGNTDRGGGWRAFRSVREDCGCREKAHVLRRAGWDAASHNQHTAYPRVIIWVNVSPRRQGGETSVEICGRESYHDFPRPLIASFHVTPEPVPGVRLGLWVGRIRSKISVG